MDYTSMEMCVFINKVLTDKNMCPCLMIGKYVNEFKRIFKGRILSVYSLDSVRKLIEMCSGLTEVQSGVIVLDGVGYLSDTGQSALLKFIEESTIPIIILSYSDKISPIIMSRMKIVVKRWDEVKSLNFQNPRDASRYINDCKDKDPSYKEIKEIEYYAERCPSAYALKFSCGDAFSNRGISERIKNLMLTIK